jgi:hypothetical protein
MENLDRAIAEFNTRADADGWMQFCDPAGSFVLRDCEALIDIWHSARGDRDLPCRDDLTARALKPFLPRLAMVERVQIDPPRFRFRVVGTKVTQTLSERTGQSFDHESATPEQTQRWTHWAILSLAAKTPLRFPIRLHKKIVGEELSLPLADKNGEPRFILSYGAYEPTRDWSVREALALAEAS